MKYGLFADIHGNLEALQATISCLEKENVDQYICCGDIVGYGPNPNECIDLIQKIKDCKIVAGNHDYAAVGLTSMRGFSDIAKEAIFWTEKELSLENKDFLKKLPLCEEKARFLIVHATVKEPENWEYIFTLSKAKSNFEQLKKDICFFGHSHRPIVFIQKSKTSCARVKKKFRLEKGYRYLINVGSVGQSRDGNPAASYVIYDEKENKLEFKRVFYDMARTKRKIIEAGLPEELSLYLERGGSGSGSGNRSQWLYRPIPG